VITLAPIPSEAARARSPQWAPQQRLMFILHQPRHGSLRPTLRWLRGGDALAHNSNRAAPSSTDAAATPWPLRQLGISLGRVTSMVRWINYSRRSSCCFHNSPNDERNAYAISGSHLHLGCVLLLVLVIWLRGKLVSMTQYPLQAPAKVEMRRAVAALSNLQHLQIIWWHHVHAPVRDELSMLINKAMQR
jgi:hypothetical protein